MTAVLQGLVAFASGLVFSIGLALSGMTQPEKITGFLDVTGAWDPSLALVMAGGVSVFAVAWRLGRRMRSPVLAARFPAVTHTKIDRRLLAGAALFGVGWGLAGYCPAPALASFGAAAPNAGLFVLAMIGGMMLHRLLARLPAPASAPAPTQPLRSAED